ncbi:MAG: DMT family transporter [Betaproteobacteria bacterium]|nr:DMT family transporter [Betaproteobacteria bacterium]
MAVSRGLASPYLLLTATSFFWSLNWVVGKALVGTVSPLTLTLIRWVVAVAAMMPFAWPQIRAHWPLVRREWKTIAWIAFWGTGLHNAFAYVGLQYTTATNGVILNSSIPILIILTGWIVYRDTISRPQMVGVLVSLAGVLAVLTKGDPGVLASLRLNAGDLIILVGIVFWAIYTVLLRMRPRELPGLALLACCGSVGILFLAPLSAAELLFLGGKVEFTPASVAAMLYVGTFPSFIGYVFWNRAVSEVGPNIAGIFIHLMPVFGSVLAWVFLGEHFRAFHFVGIALILAGVWLTAQGRRDLLPPAPR